MDLEHSRKVKNVVELLLQHENIKKMKDKPIILQWFDDDNTPKPDDDISPTDDTPSTNPKPSDACDDNPLTDDISSPSDTAKSTDVTRGKEEQKLIARRILGELLNSAKTDLGMEKQISKSEFQEALVSSGLTGDVGVIIEDMVKDGIIERVCTDLNGVPHDVLRMRGEY